MSGWAGLTVKGDSLSNQGSTMSGSVCEIEEEINNSSDHEVFGGNNKLSLSSIKEEVDSGISLFSIDFHNGGDDDQDVVYVAVGNGNKYTDSSMDALLWTLTNLVGPSTIVFLVHVFPELRYIPTPLGKLPLSQVNPEQKESYVNQERSKRREFLQKYFDLCSASKVKVDSILIESDMEAKALLDLIPILNIRKLILGTTKSSLRKFKSRRGNGIVDQLLQNTPQFCEVKIICEGKEVVVDTINKPLSLSPSPSRSHFPHLNSPKPFPLVEQNNDSFGCTCFKPKIMR